MKAVIKRSRAAGTVQAPPSKSMAHRMLICAGLSQGESTVHGIAPSQDVLATLDCLKALGAVFTYDKETVRIRGTSLKDIKAGTVLDCWECGSTLRFFIPIALLCKTDVVFKGSRTLLARPLDVYEKLCGEEGFLFERGEGLIRVNGSLVSREYKVRGDISSQFISGLLFALPLTKDNSRIRLIPPIESRPYIDMTLQALRRFGIEAFWEDENTLFVRGSQQYKAQETTVEGDYSNAAFFEALNLAGGSVEVTGLDKESLQGDKIYSTLFEKLKAGTPTIDISDCPDLGPVLMAAAALENGGVFTGTERLKIKESDRGAAMQQELEKFGIRTELSENSITVYSGELQTPKAELSGHNDHRIVMSLAVLATVTGGTIDGAQAVNKSFPDFFEKLRTLNIEVETSGMDK